MQQRPDWHGEAFPGAAERALDRAPAIRPPGVLRGLLARWRGPRAAQVPAPPAPDVLAHERGLQAGAPVPFEGEARAYAFAMAGRWLAKQARGTDAIAYGQAVQALEAALAGLPERTRQVLVRRQVNGEGEAALAAEYAVPLGMIERDVAEALHRMHSAMQGWRPQAH